MTSVKVWYQYDFYRYKNGRQNRLKIGKWPFRAKFETFDREINIEYKQIPEIYFDRCWDLSRDTTY